MLVIAVFLVQALFRFRNASLSLSCCSVAFSGARQSTPSRGQAPPEIFCQKRPCLQLQWATNERRKIFLRKYLKVSAVIQYCATVIGRKRNLAVGQQNHSKNCTGQRNQILIDYVTRTHSLLFYNIQLGPTIYQTGTQRQQPMPNSFQLCYRGDHRSFGSVSQPSYGTSRSSCV